MQLPHVYKKGYSVLPALQKLGDEPLFIQDVNYDWYMTCKKEAMQIQPCFLESSVTPKIYEVACKFISEKTGKQGSFHELITQLQEDVAIHRLEDGKDWLAACSICFPSGWDPEEKIGQPLENIHLPIPGINLRNSLQLVQGMINNGPFIRYVWSVVYNKRLNNHQKLHKISFNPADPVFHIKVEKQLTYGFPEHGFALFVLRQGFIDQIEIDKAALGAALSEMNPEQKKYKGITEEFINYINQ